jgi:hypothetical protein
MIFFYYSLTLSQVLTPFAPFFNSFQANERAFRVERFNMKCKYSSSHKMSEKERRARVKCRKKPVSHFIALLDQASECWDGNKSDLLLFIWDMSWVWGGFELKLSKSPKKMRFSILHTKTKIIGVSHISEREIKKKDTKLIIYTVCLLVCAFFHYSNLISLFSARLPLPLVSCVLCVLVVHNCLARYFQYNIISLHAAFIPNYQQPTTHFERDGLWKQLNKALNSFFEMRITKNYNIIDEKHKETSKLMLFSFTHWEQQSRELLNQ